MKLLGIIHGSFAGPNARALRAWIEAHMPELDAELGPLPQNQVRTRLNEVTGLQVTPLEMIEPTCAQFLAALKAKKAAALPVSRCGWPCCLCTWEAIVANGAACPSRVQAKPKEAP